MLNDTEFVCLDHNENYPVKIVSYEKIYFDYSEETRMNRLNDSFRNSGDPETGKLFVKNQMQESLKIGVSYGVAAVMLAYMLIDGSDIMDFPSIFETIKTGSIPGFILNTITGMSSLLLGAISKEEIEKAILSIDGLSRIKKYERDRKNGSVMIHKSDKEQDYDLKEKDAKDESDVFGSMDHSDYDNSYLFEDFDSHKIDKELDYDLNKKDAKLTELENKELETRQQMQATKSLRADYLSKDDKSKSEE